MQLTTEMLAKYVGGQMEIQNPGEEYLYRGQVETIVVEDDKLQVRFAWLAKGEGFPPIPNRWVNEEDLDFKIGLEICVVSEIEDGRISIMSPITGELSVLFPLDGSKLDPSKVEGLQLVQA